MPRKFFYKVLILLTILSQQTIFASETLTRQSMESVKDSVVKIIVASRIVDYNSPWLSIIERGTGSGFFIKGNRILTNAHVVSNATFIEVKSLSSSRRYQAVVEAISHDADLAILKLKEENDEFFDAPILELSELPELQEGVEAYGYPTGGSGLSITKGVVSRIERDSYIHKDKYFISVQIDAAINPGNSGGPVISNGKVVGVVMQTQKDSQSIAYMIPTPVIRHFLSDILDGEYDGYPSLGIDTAYTRSPAVRELYNLGTDTTGVLVTFVYPNSPTEGKLQKNDIITAIDGLDIDNEGKTILRKKERISFYHYVDMHQLDENIKLDIFRAGEALTIDIKLNKTGSAFMLVGDRQFEIPPSYFIYGGFVFLPLTFDYVDASQGYLDTSLQVLSLSWPTEEKEQVVLIAKVLPDSSNKGYHDISDFQIETINGKTFKNFKQFYEMFNKSDSQFIVLENRFGYQVVIHRKNGKEHQGTILQRYHISESKSVDLKNDTTSVN